MKLRVLNLGAGVQSSALYLMAFDGEIEIDFAIFADTGDEPRETYEHLEWLKSLSGPEIVTVSAGNLGDNLKHGVNSTGGRFVSIPAFLSIDGLINSGIGRRQCTNEYKIIPIEKEIRKRLGVDPGKRVPKGSCVTQVFGLSFDEPRRVMRVKDQYRSSSWKFAEFPLFDWFMTRGDCLAYLSKRIPGRVIPRSACVYCPYHSDSEWLKIKSDPEAWARAVEIDTNIRDETSACNRGMNAKQFLHRSCQPLAEVVFRSKESTKNNRLDFVTRDCEGMCGV